jgi:hypothetical protein
VGAVVTTFAVFEVVCRVPVTPGNEIFVVSATAFAVSVTVPEVFPLKIIEFAETVDVLPSSIRLIRSS